MDNFYLLEKYPSLVFLALCRTAAERAQFLIKLSRYQMGGSEGCRNLYFLLISFAARSAATGDRYCAAFHLMEPAGALTGGIFYFLPPSAR